MTRPVLERSRGNQSGQHWEVMEKAEREPTFLESGLKEGTSHRGTEGHSGGY